MSYSKITRYNNCDILIGCNDVSRLGFDKTKTEGEMIDLAVINDCSIIIKSGKNGKWFLKGKGKSKEYLQNKIQKNINKYSDDVFCLFLE